MVWRTWWNGQEGHQGEISDTRQLFSQARSAQSCQDRDSSQQSDNFYFLIATSGDFSLPFHSQIKTKRLSHKGQSCAKITCQQLLDKHYAVILGKYCSLFWPYKQLGNLFICITEDYKNFFACSPKWYHSLTGRRHLQEARVEKTIPMVMTQPQITNTGMLHSPHFVPPSPDPHFAACIRWVTWLKVDSTFFPLPFHSWKLKATILTRYQTANAIEDVRTKTTCLKSGMQIGHLLFWYPEHLSSPFEDSEKKHSPVPFPPRLNFIYSEIGARGLQGLCSLPLAVAVSPSGWAMRCIAVAATQTGMLIFCPKTEVDRSITDTSLSTRGYSFHLTQRNRIKYLHHWGYSSRCPRADFPVIRRKKDGESWRGGSNTKHQAAGCWI